MPDQYKLGDRVTLRGGVMQIRASFPKDKHSLVVTKEEWPNLRAEAIEKYRQDYGRGPLKILAPYETSPQEGVIVGVRYMREGCVRACKYEQAFLQVFSVVKVYKVAVDLYREPLTVLPEQIEPSRRDRE